MTRRRGMSVFVALALVASLVLAVGGPAAAKKKHRKGGPAVVTKPVSAAIPDATGVPPNVRWGQLRSDIAIGKKFKGKTIGDVNVTIQTTGAGPNAAEDLEMRLTAPNGATTDVLPNLFGRSVGPLTLDDDTPVRTCGQPTPCADPLRSLNPPYAGTARSGGFLSILDSGPIMGTWRLSAFDTQPFDPQSASTLVSWTLTVTPARPVK
jgi:hypothetical protein